MHGMMLKPFICSTQAAQAQSTMLCHVSPSDKHRETAGVLQECILQKTGRRLF